MELMATSPTRAVPVEKIAWPTDPADVTVDVVIRLVDALRLCGKDPGTIRRVFTFANLSRLIRQAETALQACPNVVTVVAPDDGAALNVFGDTHGQFYDLLNVFSVNGYPSMQNWYIFNGDFVDRGSWGLEVAVTLFAFKLLYPGAVHLIRGNHETLYCTRTYGFMEECKVKYSKAIYAKFHSAFSRLPLACVILPSGSTVPATPDGLPAGSGLGIFVVHGGLYRQPDGSAGTLSQLQAVKRNVKDPQAEVLLDALWSDPQTVPGIEDNTLRGCATLFGPDVTEAFLKAHGLSLLVRSHEGPDAREKRPHMPNNMMSGFGIDQTYGETGAPLCISIFSAPNYPMGSTARGNLGAFLRFDGPRLRTLEPEVKQFGAVTRPPVRTYFVEPQPDLTDMSDGTPR
ncbi:Serine/threonine-protein phosphatase [Plasmodiophora brassicae]